eukprot:TRINITY_DN884_c0_g1_i1.p1 TRINITY_DN884_c0_g1~~TRINITY_DN884_c0_g1_i1.p1  ORF type:complete len:276 (+),score=24.69 TRINITY_DN884_c0_g1_i1:22-828(+)
MSGPHYHMPLHRMDPVGDDIRAEMKQSKLVRGAMPTTRTSSPIVTGTSVLAVKYNGGVVMGCDTLASYGSLARFFELERMVTVGDYTIMGAGGEYSDFQYLRKVVDELDTDDFCRNDGSRLHPEEIYNYLTRVMYNRRNKGDPLWNSVVVIGRRDGHSFLGTVDLQGTCYKDDFIATGYGAYLALPLMRKAWRPDLTQEEAVKLIEDCLRVLFYRDARASAKVQIAIASDAGTGIGPMHELETYGWQSGEYAIRSLDSKLPGIVPNRN